MDNKRAKTIENINEAHSLAVVLARATEDDPHVLCVAQRIATLLGDSVIQLNNDRLILEANAA